MTRLQEKAKARTKRIIGQMVGDNELVEEGKEEHRRAEGCEAADVGDRTEGETRDNPATKPRRGIVR
ncbi:uncharacterized protein YjbJ (UPF0337 family) [Bradyrhizobium sp. S3.2.6]|uniref:hypothetical protein n=1 Tax=Bradyrhizobium sp. S3.2.6 TaxID=3156428 RepID=UPI00339AF901